MLSLHRPVAFWIRVGNVRNRKLVVSAVLAMSVTVLVPGAGHADASTSTTIYVSDLTSSCSDSGPGTSSTAPYCSLQAATDAAEPGDTVMVIGGYSNVDITRSGTADAPITIETPEFNYRAQMNEPASSTTPALTLDHVSYVNIKNLFFGDSDAQMVYVNGSDHVTLDNLEGGIETAGGLLNPTDSGLPGIHVTGDSSAVTISRSKFLDMARSAPTVQIDAGGSGDVITTNGFEGGFPAISVDGTPGTDIVSNTVMYSTVFECGTAVSLTGASTGSYIENNVLEPSNTCSGSSNPTGLLSVSAASTAGTTVNYNVLDPNENWGTAPGDPQGPDEYAYAWAGQFYKTVADFTAASGQGQHDVIGNPELGNAWGFNFFTNTVASPAINSANSDAPGELTTDLNNKARVADPLVPENGAGTYGYYDRGAAQIQPSASTTVTTSANGALGVTATSTAWLSDGWSFDFGDGTQVEAGTYGVASHTYAKPGTYTITISGTSMVNGQPFTATDTFTTTGSDYTPYGPTRILDTRKGLGAQKAKVPAISDIRLTVAGNGSIPADVTAVALNVTVTDTVGNGYISVFPSNGNGAVSNLNYLAGQTVTNSVIVPVGVDGDIALLNMGKAGGSADLIADVSGYFTRSASSSYSAVTPARILDTRHGTGAPTATVAPNHGLSVGIVGVDSIPAGTTAVALHVTATDTTANGWIAAEPDGAGIPSTSNLNYLKGQTVANTVIVPVAPDGKIELYNGGGTGSVDLIADVTGYFSTNSAEVYTAVIPYRAWDSRKSGVALGADTTTTYALNNGILPPGTPVGATLITNVTVTDLTANGFVTAFPAGAVRPGVSNLNYLSGQTVAGMSLLAATGSTQQISIYNQSTGHGDVILDVFGYFSG